MSVDVSNLVRLLRDGASDRTIARTLGINRRTVARYRRLARAEGVLAGAVPNEQSIYARMSATRSRGRSSGRVSSVDAFRDEIAGMQATGLSVAAIRVQLEQRHRQPVSYMAVWRLVERLSQHTTAGATADAADSSTPSQGERHDVNQTAETHSAHPLPPAGATATAAQIDAPLTAHVSARMGNEDKLAERHAHLVATATDLLLHRGFHRTTVRDIAAAAGWQIGTLYLYISRKEDILLLILDNITRTFLFELRQVERQATARATLRTAAERYFRTVARLHRELRLLYRESASLDPEQRVFGMKREFDQRDILADILRWGMANGEFRQVDPEIFAHTIIMLAHMWGLKGWALIRSNTLDYFIGEQLDLLFSRLDAIPVGPERRDSDRSNEGTNAVTSNDSSPVAAK